MATKGKGGALTMYDAEFAKLAAEAAQQEANTGGGNFISIKGGMMAVNGAPVPNNQAAVVVLDSVLVNAYYEGEYDPDNPQSPSCFAIGRDEKTLAPHEESVDKQSADCASCPHNQFGTADKGRGKRCKNIRRVAVISAGQFENGKLQVHKDLEQFTKGERYYINVPPTSIQGYGGFVKQLAGALKVPPFGVFTKMSLVPDPKSQVKLTFEPLSRIPATLNGTVLERHRAEREQIMFPFPKPEDQPARKAGKKAPKAGKKAPAQGRGRF